MFSRNRLGHSETCELRSKERLEAPNIIAVVFHLNWVKFSENELFGVLCPNALVEVSATYENIARRDPLFIIFHSNA